MVEQILTGQTLIFDADDTLWENNIYFERAFADFVAFLDHEHLTAAEIQVIMDDLERATRHTHGYGARAFASRLRDTYQHIHPVDDADPVLDEVEAFGLRILEQEFELLPGVEKVLEALKPHHRLVMLTKGNDDEQRAKIARSGIEHHFDGVAIPSEKSVETYREALITFDSAPETTWMIGNSPRSDINPALAAGLNAVYIPHPNTWHLEVEEVIVPEGEHGRLVELASVRDLATVFEATS